MLLGGLQKTTVIDFPGKVACTVFTVSCNFRCPFCHNKDLVTSKLFAQAKTSPLKEEDFFSFLEKRKRILDGVCITGGEPTLQPDLLPFCLKIKKLGLGVKLDSNGSNPWVLQKLFKQKAVDFVAMDIKTSFSDYKKAIGIKFPIARIKESINLILTSGVDFEFRTTLVPGIHTFLNIKQLVWDLKKIVRENKIEVKDFNYALQLFRPQNCLDASFLNKEPFSEIEAEKIFDQVKKVFPKTVLKGVD